MEFSGYRKVWKFGESRSIIDNQRGGFEGKDGVIGVYDSSNFKHLESMLWAATEATRSKGSCWRPTMREHRIREFYLRVRFFIF
jgi:hypothetical protein